MNEIPQTVASEAPELASAISNIVEKPFSWWDFSETILLIVGCILAVKILIYLFDKFLSRSKIEVSLHTFIKSTLRILLWAVALLVVWEHVGLPVSTLLGVLGVAGLAISLALQGTLANLAGGLMILSSKPFIVDDYIEAGGVEGTVADVGLVYTRIRTVDNKLIFVPNGQISGEKIVNYTHQPRRRVDLTFDVSYDADGELVKEVIRARAEGDPRVLRDPEIFVRATAFKDSAVAYTLRAWCMTEDYWGLYFDLLEGVRADFVEKGIEIPYNQLDVHLVDKP